MKIAVIKLEEKSEGIRELFNRFGHEAIIISTLRVAPPTDAKPLERMAEMASKGELDILIFTSALGAEKLFEKAKPTKNIRIVSVVPKTAKKVEKYGFIVENLIFQTYSCEYFAYLAPLRCAILFTAEPQRSQR